MHQFGDTAVAVRTHGSQIRLLADTLGLEQPKCPSCHETLSTCHETLSKIALFSGPPHRFFGYGVPSRCVYPLASAIMSMSGYVHRSCWAVVPISRTRAGRPDLLTR